MKRSLIAVVLAALFSAGFVTTSEAFDWSGFYAGFSLGYSAGTTVAAYDNPVFAGLAGPLNSSPAGFLGGVQLGVNQALGNGVMIGVEGDVDYGNVTATINDVLGGLHDPAPPYYITSSTDFSGTIRGRVGFEVGQLLPYLTAGVAAARATVHATDGNLSQSAVLFGYTAGTGIEFALNDSATVKAEYLYTDLGSHQWFAGQAYSSTAHSTSSTVRVGVNFKLN